MMFYQYSAIRRQIFKKWETNTFIEFFLDILQTGKKYFPLMTTGMWYWQYSLIIVIYLIYTLGITIVPIKPQLLNDTSCCKEISRR